MKLSPLHVLIPFICLVGCASHIPGMSRDQKQIKMVWDECLNALQSKDTVKMSAFWVQDSTEMFIRDATHAGPVLGWKDLKIWEPLLHSLRTVRLKTSQIDIQTSRDDQSAGLAATINFLAKLPTENISGTLFVQVYLIKRGEQWLIVHINQSRFPA